ncbi:MAG: hypothetical protein GY761_06480 [Hyphomicrobiales bacterium]|nr:hypothetical protein [Hyphomicrobiales bacterium]
MSTPGSFLGGARSRLLPASVPFRFFIAACVFHPLAWLALFAGAQELALFSGGPGYVLASIHLLTLGVLAMTAMGASFQLLPIVTLRPLGNIWPAIASFWLFLPGVILLAFGMISAHTPYLNWGAGLVVSGLAFFTVLTANNLRRAGNLPVVAAHGWGAIAALIIFAMIGALLTADLERGFLTDHQQLAIVHMIVAIFGFMGLLAIGLSLILVPMFALSRSLSTFQGWLQLMLTVAAIVTFCAATLMDSKMLGVIAVAIGFAAVTTHFRLMRIALTSGMRKRLGLSFVLVRSSWGLLAVGLLTGLAIMAGFSIPNGPALFGFLILAGWLLTFLTGILQRIMPFLASMHAAGASGMPPMLSDLTAKTPLKIHAACHFAALGLCSTGIGLERTIIIEFGAIVGLIGSVSFLVFAVRVIYELKKHYNPE